MTFNNTIDLGASFDRLKDALHESTRRLDDDKAEPEFVKRLSKAYAHLNAAVIVTISELELREPAVTPTNPIA